MSIIKPFRGGNLQTMTDKTKVYIETSIPSFYYEDRQDAAAIARREWTQQWWDNQRHHYQLVSSQAVWDELNEGNYPKQANCLAFIKKTAFLNHGARDKHYCTNLFTA